jgi:Ribonuclease G/E
LQCEDESASKSAREFDVEAIERQIEDTNQRVKASPEYGRLTVEWAECARTAGVNSQSLDELKEEFYRAVQNASSDAAIADRERSVATATFECNTAFQKAYQDLYLEARDA